MNITLKIDGSVLDSMRSDLARPHFFAHERIGFLTAGATFSGQDLMLLVRNYTPVEDDDYERAPGVGARIGSNAMRKAVQSVYRPAGALLHIHTHGGLGRPGFSGIDLASADEFVPGFFETTPRMPHGLLVLSNNSVRGQVWLTPNGPALPISRFTRIGDSIQNDWGINYGMA